MDNDSSKILKSILKAIKLTKMQDIDNYILTITAKDNKSNLPQSGCVTRCLLLYIIKNKVFDYNVDPENSKYINVVITLEKLSTIYDVLNLSPELRSLLMSGEKHGMTLISNNPQGLLEIIS
jgi:hypothetical protein